jgi:serine/threonine protein kinase
LPPPALKGYAFQELLGRGGFSHVHRAVHVASSSSVAVKVRARVVVPFGVSSQASLKILVPLNQPPIAPSPKYTLFFFFFFL